METIPRERALRIAREKIVEAQELLAPYRNRSLPLHDARGFLDFAGDRIDAVLVADYPKRPADGPEGDQR